MDDAVWWPARAVNGPGTPGAEPVAAGVRAGAGVRAEAGGAA